MLKETDQEILIHLSKVEEDYILNISRYTGITFTCAFKAIKRLEKLKILETEKIGRKRIVRFRDSKSFELAVLLNRVIGNKVRKTRLNVMQNVFDL